nr:MAG TPA: hypothetical protein [Bacteriophage sp.]
MKLKSFVTFLNIISFYFSTPDFNYIVNNNFYKAFLFYPLTNSNIYSTNSIISF